MTTSETICIDGSWETGRDDPIDVINPTTETKIASVGSASKTQVVKALKSSSYAQKEWAKLSPVQRGEHLRDIANALKENADKLSRICMSEVGKPLSQAVEEVENSSNYSIYTAEWDRRIEGEILPSDEVGESIHLMRSPLGVISAITAWNYPIELFFRKVAPALLTGNTVVLKPSEVAPLSSVALTKLIHDTTNLPKGVLNLVTGGRETGAEMVSNPLTAMVSMTGHRDTGKHIMASAAANLTRVSLELGGTAPAIVWADADLDVAVEAIITARHTNSGQVCTCAERIFVHKHIYKEFVERYIEAARSLTMGDPLNDPDLGPLVNAAQFKKVSTAVEKAKSEGVKLAFGGNRSSNPQFEKGFWYEPTVFVDVDPSAALMRDEIFGPVSPIAPFSELSEVLAYANDSRYGLSAFIFSNDYHVIMCATQELEYGEIYVNRTMGEALQAHHIGHKESGIGGEDGKYGVLKYTQLKSIYHKYA